VVQLLIIWLILPCFLKREVTTQWMLLVVWLRQHLLAPTSPTTKHQYLPLPTTRITYNHLWVKHTGERWSLSLRVALLLCADQTLDGLLRQLSIAILMATTVLPQVKCLLVTIINTEMEKLLLVFLMDITTRKQLRQQQHTETIIWQKEQLLLLQRLLDFTRLQNQYCIQRRIDFI